MTFKANQIQLISAIRAELSRQAKEEGINDLPLHPKQYNSIIEGANLICDGLKKEPIPSWPGMGLGAWLSCDDIGSSSNALAYYLTGLGENAENATAHPCDAADLGRCVRFLDAVPSVRPDLYKASNISYEWEMLFNNWPELEALYRAGKSKELTQRIQELIKR